MRWYVSIGAVLVAGAMAGGGPRCRLRLDRVCAWVADRRSPATGCLVLVCRPGVIPDLDPSPAGAQASCGLTRRVTSLTARAPRVRAETRRRRNRQPIGLAEVASAALAFVVWWPAPLSVRLM